MMINLDSLPQSFEDLLRNPPSEIPISTEVLSPRVQYSICGGRISAFIVAKSLTGEAILPPSQSHQWAFIDGKIQPFPRGTISAFQDQFKNQTTEDLSYLDFRKHIENENSPVPCIDKNMHLPAGEEAADLYKILQTPIPGLQATLYPYQEKGVRWINQTAKSHGGLILADEMGLGKTIQAIAVMLQSNLSKRSPALILCPTSLISNWSREIQKFAPSLTHLIHFGQNRTGLSSGLQRSQIVICSYETMVRDFAIFDQIKWSWLLCDEAQAIKNPLSERRISTSRLSREKTMLITGTPMENSLFDLWSLADMAIPGILGEAETFPDRFPDNLKSAQNLSQIIGPIMLKRSVEKVAGDLPERISIDLPLTMQEHIAKKYDLVRKETLQNYPVGGPLVATQKLRMFCSDPSLLNESQWNKNAETLTYRNPLLSQNSEKMERVLAIMHEAIQKNRKILVFSEFNKMGDYIAEEFAKVHNVNSFAPYWSFINGSTPQSDRQKIVDEFSSYKGPAILILNPKAAGAGLNIVAATVVIHYSPYWNPAIESQASARAHRRGQTLPVTIYRLYYQNTVEEIMINRSAWKTELGEESVPISSRDEQDLEEALNISPLKGAQHG